MPHGDSGHHHHHHHHHHHDQAARNIGLAFWLNLIFAGVELAGGLYTQSLAIVSDALHDFGDALSLGLGYVLQVKSARGPDESFSYGRRRLSLLSALITGLVIAGGAGFIAVQSAREFGSDRHPNGPGMLLFALLGIAVNGFAAYRMSLGHTQNEKVLRWHLIEDILGWIAVFIGGILVWAFEWTWIDPVLAFGISLFVLYNVLKNVRVTVNLFLQANPDPAGLREFRARVTEIAHVVGVHDVHFWSLDGVHHILSLHAVIKSGGDALTVKTEIRRLSAALGECHVTVEIETESEPCASDCEHP